MSELLDRVLAAAKAVEDAGHYTYIRGRSVNFARGETEFKALMAARRKPAPKYKNAALWKKYRDPRANYLLSCSGSGGKH